MQSVLMLHQVVCVVNTGLERVILFWLEDCCV